MHQKSLVAHIRKLLITVGCLLATTLTSLSAYADDTEVFFSSARGGTLSKSNILFVLDNSGSMGYDYDNNWRWGADYSTPQNYPADPNRMSDLQATMDTLLQGIKNVNIGIMQFTYDCVPSNDDCASRDNYARLVHDVMDIDTGNNRATLRQSVANMLPRTNTPITAALYEAAMVMTGGKKGRLPGNYRQTILSECQQNHIVILSDGIANSDVPKVEIETLMRSVGPAPYLTCPSTGAAKGDYCGVQLAEWLQKTDHHPVSSSPTSVKVNPINVHTVAFALNSTYMDELADAGNGGNHKADNAQELAEVFNTILREVKDVDTTFVAPVTSTDRLNRLGQSDDLYFAMFNPSIKPQWDGNLKKYTLGIDSNGDIVIKDANNIDAINPATGYFSDQSKSVWSNLTDGAFVTKGGAASKISHLNRNMYTSIGASLSPATNGANPINLATNANGFATKFHEANTSLTSTHLGVASNTERNTLINWARGVDTDDIKPDSEHREHIGDILHSTPISINYEDAKGSLIFFGTNEGFLHAINSNDGTEEYSFIPQELLGNLKIFHENNRDDPHPYGLDGALTYVHIDDYDDEHSAKDGDGLVNNNEFAAIFFGMRRGGRDYYSLDVSSRSKPKLNWHIKGGTGEFASLGQSWSEPTPAQIRYKDEVRQVLIFGGGYDENQDPTNEDNLDQIQSTDAIGNAIYIVDVFTGELIWKADGNKYADMDYSIPSDIRVLDVDSDGLADRMYVGDMGGQVWRFDINSGHAKVDNSSTLVYGGVLAKLGGKDNGDPTISGARRFYSKPDVALITKEGQHFMSVAIGSGWRAHPLNRDIDDRFYMIRDNRPLEKIMNDADFGAINTQTNSDLAADWGPVKEGHLRDITELATQPIPSETGWMLKFDDSVGEKSLSGSLTINNQLVFASYTGEVHKDECLPASDSTTVYAVDILRGDPVLPLDSGSDSGNLTKFDRSKKKATNGIPPAPVPVIKQNTDGSYSTGIILGTSPILENLSFSDLTRRTYWHDRRRGSTEPADVVAEQCEMGNGNQSHNGNGKGKGGIKCKGPDS